MTEEQFLRLIGKEELVGVDWEICYIDWKKFGRYVLTNRHDYCLMDNFNSSGFIYYWQDGENGYRLNYGLCLSLKEHGLNEKSTGSDFYWLNEELL